MKFFVYGLYVSGENKPFYIGKGKGRRASTHLWETPETRNQHKENKIASIKSMGMEPRIEYLAEDIGLGGTWIQTSYNTRGGVHYGQDGQPDGGVALRMNYAGIGYTYAGVGFAAPQPFPSWTKNPDTYLWEAPTPAPQDGKMYTWDEATTSWVEVTQGA